MSLRPALPIDEILPEIESALRTPGRNLVIEAAPGAGKTTAIPLSLLGPGKILDARRAKGLAGKALILEPRRIAARMASSTCALWANTQLGDEVGYRVRFESAVSDATKLCFVTQALYLRMLLGSPQLRDYGVVIFDEFHERNLASDLALALTLALQRSHRPDLQIIAMSATLDAEPVAKYLEAQSFRNQGRSYPVTIHHASYQRKQEDKGPSLLKVLAQVQEQSLPGHILVFLPGLHAIETQHQQIERWAKNADFAVHRLHGSMNKAAQKEVVAPSQQRKIILATNVAESSVTIPGIGIVVDFGQAKIARADLITGKTTLETRAVSRASAIQRSGRAGRTGPGVAFRLYSEADFNRRMAFERPEVERLDPSSTLLTIAALGFDPRHFDWFEAPKPTQLESALSQLDSLDLLREGKITPLGQLAAMLPLDPPAARAVVELARGNLELAARVGALLSVDDKTLGALRRFRPASDQCDVLADLSAWKLARASAKQDASIKLLEHHRTSLASTLNRQKSEISKLGPGLLQNFGPKEQDDWVRCCLARGFLRALGKLDEPRKPGSRIVMAGKGSAQRQESSVVLDDSPWVVVLACHERSGKTLAQRLCTVQEEWLLELCPNLESQIKVQFDEQRQEVFAQEALMVGQLTLEEQTLNRLPPPGVELLYKKTLAAGLANFFDFDALENFLARCAFVHRFAPEVPALTMENAHAQWKALCAEHTKFFALKQANFVELFRHSAQEHLATIDNLAPSHISLASGRRLRLSYQGDREPGISSRLQDFFGSKVGPSVMRGQVPVRLHLLAPNGRDVQVTTDLEGFWERHYPALRKTLMRRYPRHAWPEDPVNAEPPKPRPRRPRGKK